MIKKIPVSRLKPGMYVHDFHCSWLKHPFLRNQFLLTKEAEIEKIVKAGILELYIDTSKGLDDGAIAVDEARAVVELELADLAARRPLSLEHLSLDEELGRATALKERACEVVKRAMSDARLGAAVDLAEIDSVVQDVTQSILSNPGALSGLLLLRTKDAHTYEHSLSVCALMVCFCRFAGMDEETVRQAGIGGLLHDIGKALVPDHILNKPMDLTDAEREIRRRHVQDGHAILFRTPSIGAIPLDIVLHHHERTDGSGYPTGKPAAETSYLAQMAAIVDVYDTLSSDRPYQKAISPAEALRKLYEWSASRFDRGLVQDFIRCVGIYPVGTLVLLASDRLAVVVEQNGENLLAPKVHVFYDTKLMVHITPEALDLSAPGCGDRILSDEVPEKWLVHPLRFMTLPK